MDSAALHLFSALRGDASGGDVPAGPRIEPLDAFACLVLGRPPGALPATLARTVAAAVASGRRRLETGRATPPPRLLRAYPFREVYRAVRSRAAKAGPSRPAAPSGPRRPSALALEAVLQLRHRQRAALALRCILGFRDDEIAYVLGVSRAEAVRVVEAGIAAVRRLGDRSIDVDRALRDVGHRAAAAPEARPATRPADRLPREVVRVLLAPVPDARPVPDAAPAGASKAPLPTPSPPLPQTAKVEAPSGPPARIPPPPVRRRRGVLALVAAAAAIVAAALVPASGQGPDAPAAPAPAAPALAAPAPAVGEQPGAPAPSARPAVLPATVVRVAPGDSLWRIAERHLGDPYRWTEIWRLNRGARMPGGRAFTDPDLIHPGWRLRLPPPA